jgi:alpha-L-rhamnosidase
MNLLIPFLRKSFALLRMTFLLFILSLFHACNRNGENCTPSSLKCEYLVNPVGIDTPHPRLTWQMTDDRRGAFQTGCRIILGTDSISVSENNGNIWDSGRIKSDRNLISYTGPPLYPFTRYYWRVILRDRDNKESRPSTVASFETGMMDRRNWKGSWISDTRDITLKPAPYFRKNFKVTKKIRSARAYIAVAGLYELYLNGRKTGDHMLDPAYTRFDRRTLYVTHDITSSIREGDNVIGVLLGNGWYNHQSTAVWYFHEAPWRSRPKFCADIRIVYEDGSLETITTGTDWKTSLSPVIFNSIYTAEHYDARLEQPGWNSNEFDDRKWANAIPVGAPSLNITSQAMHPIKLCEEIPARTMTRISERILLFDLGRNIAGICRLKVSGEAGTTIRLKHAERLDAKGRADQSNIAVHYRPTDDKDPFQTDIFILSGRGEETFMPHFNYKGFQYVEVSSDKPLNLSEKSLTGFFMHSDVPVAGHVESSNPTMDRIWQAANNSYLSNLFGYPTDCPQREKNGWTGDAHIAVETGLYNFDGITVYEKWLADHRDEQQPNGVLPAIIPTGGWGYTWANGPDWTSTIAIIPWNIYLFYGDSHLLIECYPNLKRYVDFIDENWPSGLTDWGLGDWIPVKSVAPKELTSSVYYYVDVTILARAAKIIGNNPDHERYIKLAAKIRDAVNGKYLNRETGIYGSGLQTELSVPLKWGLVPDELKGKVAANLAKRVASDNNHIDVGLLGTKAILNALSENGYADQAYMLASQETFPSWGWWIVNGATTLFENWPIDSKSDISLNHIMFGEISAWMYKALGGILPDEEKPGFKNVILKPHFVKGLDNFEAIHNSPYGMIISSWKREKDSILYSVTIPPNSTATIFLEGETILENGKDISGISEIKASRTANDMTLINTRSGKYSFSFKQKLNP